MSKLIVEVNKESIMPEIYVCLQNLRYEFGMKPKSDKKLLENFKDFELKIGIDMEQNRAKLFGC